MCLSEFYVCIGWTFNVLWSLEARIILFSSTNNTVKEQTQNGSGKFASIL